VTLLCIHRLSFFPGSTPPWTPGLRRSFIGLLNRSVRTPFQGAQTRQTLKQGLFKFLRQNKACSPILGQKLQNGFWQNGLEAENFGVLGMVIPIFQPKKLKLT